MHSRKTLFTLSRWAIFATALAMPVAAQAAMVQVAVHYDDLRLSNPAGARTLLVRLKSAARQVCGGLPEKTDLGGVVGYQGCLRGSLEQAVATLDRPEVTALYHEMAH